MADIDVIGRLLRLLVIKTEEQNDLLRILMGAKPKEKVVNIKPVVKVDVSSLERQIKILSSSIDRFLNYISYEIPPPDAKPIDIAPEPVNVGIGERKTIIEYTVTKDHAVIRWFGQSLSDASGYDYVKWSIFKNGAPFYPYVDFVGEFSSIVDNELMEIVPIKLKKNDTIKVVVENPTTSSSVYGVTARVKGWEW